MGDYSVTMSYANDPLLPGTVIQAVHLTQLRTAVDALRALANRGPYSWTDTSPAGQPVRALHIAQLREAVNEARQAMNMTVVFFTGGTAGSPIQAADFTQIRNLVK